MTCIICENQIYAFIQQVQESGVLIKEKPHPKKHHAMETRFNHYVALKGSFKPAPQATPTEDTSKNEQITVTIRVKPKQALPDVLTSPDINSLTREEFHKTYGASAEDIEKVTDFADHYGLSLVKVDPNTRTVKVQGTLQQMEDAFKTAVTKYKDKEGCTFRARSGELQVPMELNDIIEGIFGLDNRAVATPKFKIRQNNTEGKIAYARAVNTSFTSDQLARIYDYPTDVTGKGQCIAIIELGGGYKTADISSYFNILNIPRPKVKAISVDGAHNSPSTPDSADGEVLLDIEVAGAVAHGATLAVYFAPNTDSGFLDAITQAIHDTTYKPSIISISWGAPEVNWTAQSLQAYNSAFQEAAAMGVTVCAAAGDTGSNDGVNDGAVHVDVPASSPYVLACGGTRLNVDAADQITEEVVWHAGNDSATGGGISDVFPLPDYQSASKVPVSLQTKQPGRGVPDLAAVADPATGYEILVDGQHLVIGGTSAVAPLMAGLIALINEKLQRPAGFIHKKLYASADVCRDITEGDNITADSKGYKAGEGWDACTGKGVPVGSKLLQILT
jgi:kumamolisin